MATIPPAAAVPATPRVQVLLAAFNSGPYLAAQLTSILEQTHPNLTLLIRDDASADATPAILSDFAARHPGRIQLLPPGPHRGAMGNFALLLDAAAPGYVMCADADDVWLPEKVAMTLDVMVGLEDRHGPGTPILVHTDARVVDRDLHAIAPSLWRYQYLDPVRGRTLNRLLAQNVVTGCTMMLNAALLEAARPVPRQAVMYDWWVALVAAATGVIGVVPQATMLYRQHAQNAIGAQPWGLARLGRRVAGLVTGDEFHQTWRCSQDQATALWERLGGRIAPDVGGAIEAFATLSRLGPLERRRLILRHRFYRVGTLRNMRMFMRV